MKRPWSVQIELTEGCNRLCSFCGLNAIRDGPGNYKYMTMETAEVIGEQAFGLAPTARYEFAMHGEPLQHPGYRDRIGTLRWHLPEAQFQLTTNGKVLMGKMPERLQGVFRAGIDIVVLDTYEPERQQLIDEARSLDHFNVVDFYDDWAPAGKSPWTNYHRKVTATVVLMDDLALRSGERKSRTITNQGGNSPARPALTEPLKKTCTLPFREIAICWNGDVRICCNDWRGEYKVGNIHERTLTSIWTGPEFHTARVLLQNKIREFKPCRHCDLGSGSRSGLLPKYELTEVELQKNLRAAQQL